MGLVSLSNYGLVPPSEFGRYIGLQYILFL
jgi:hypothetical protein